MKSEQSMINTSETFHSKTQGMHLISAHMLKLASTLDSTPLHPVLFTTGRDIKFER